MLYVEGYTKLLLCQMQVDITVKTTIFSASGNQTSVLTECRSRKAHELGNMICKKVYTSKYSGFSCQYSAEWNSRSLTLGNKPKVSPIFSPPLFPLFPFPFTLTVYLRSWRVWRELYEPAADPSQNDLILITSQHLDDIFKKNENTRIFTQCILAEWFCDMKYN